MNFEPVRSVAFGPLALAESAVAPDTGGLVVSNASIVTGRLIITGVTATAKKLVTLDGVYTIKSGADRNFTFSLATYHPANCVVTLTAPGAMTTAVVANCASGFAARGAWSSIAKYKLNDLVTYQGSTWRARRDPSRDVGSQSAGLPGFRLQAAERHRTGT